MELCWNEIVGPEGIARDSDLKDRGLSFVRVTICQDKKLIRHVA